jgi:hypothetical protein
MLMVEAMEQMNIEHIGHDDPHDEAIRYDGGGGGKNWEAVGYIYNRKWNIPHKKIFGLI